MRRLLDVLFWGLIALYTLALLVLAVGLLGAEKEPLSAVYVVILGLPWTRAIEGVPGWALPWLTTLAPLLNIALLGWLRRVAKHR